MTFGILNLTFGSLSFHLAHFITTNGLELQLTLPSLEWEWKKYLLHTVIVRTVESISKAPRVVPGTLCVLNKLTLLLLLVYAKTVKINSLGIF